MSCSVVTLSSLSVPCSTLARTGKTRSARRDTSARGANAPWRRGEAIIQRTPAIDFPTLREEAGGFRRGPISNEPVVRARKVRVRDRTSPRVGVRASSVVTRRADESHRRAGGLPWGAFLGPRLQHFTERTWLARARASVSEHQMRTVSTRDGHCPPPGRATSRRARATLTLPRARITPSWTRRWSSCPPSPPLPPRSRRARPRTSEAPPR